jgi:hypothetical protein
MKYERRGRPVRPRAELVRLEIVRATPPGVQQRLVGQVAIWPVARYRSSTSSGPGGKLQAGVVAVAVSACRCGA